MLCQQPCPECGRSAGWRVTIVRKVEVYFAPDGDIDEFEDRPQYDKAVTKPYCRRCGNVLEIIEGFDEALKEEEEDERDHIRENQDAGG